MTIIEALKAGRIDFIPKSRRWLYYVDGDWIVKANIKNKPPKVLIVTKDEEEAVAYLIGEKLLPRPPYDLYTGDFSEQL